MEFRIIALPEEDRFETMDAKAMGQKAPCVSVVMPAYNASRFIEAAVRSVMLQSFPDWELIVVDDGSTDDTCAIVRSLASEDLRIRLVENEENMGTARSRNRGLELARGAYVALLDSDDLWRRDKLERQILLAKETGADVVYCSYGIVDAHGEKMCEDFIVPEVTDFDSTLTQSVISCSTALLTRETADAYRFGTAFFHEDLALWLKLLSDGCCARGIREVLADYRVTGRGRSRNKLRSAWGRWEIYRDCLGYSLAKSFSLLSRYGMLAVRKYRSIGKREWERAYGR